MIKQITKDLRFLLQKDDIDLRDFIYCLFDPGFLAVILLRIQLKLSKNNAIKFLVKIVSLLNYLITGVQIMPGSKIGCPLIIRHPSGIVIGEHAIVGDFCIISQGVTLGKKSISPVHMENDGYPVVGHHVEIGAYAQLFGMIVIPDGKRINSLEIISSNEK
jgi:serine O-acetyltransferase